MSESIEVVKGLVVPGLPHILLSPDKKPQWKKVRQAFEKMRTELESVEADCMIIYSTYWPSVIGHQIQARPEPEWVHVDDQFHDIGSIPYKFKIDHEYAEAYKNLANAKGLHARTVNYHGFPIDTGSVVAMKLLNPNNRWPATMVSSNIYSDRAETIVLGKAGREALKKQNKKAIAVVVTSLSNRLYTDQFEPSEEKIHSKKDEEWNRKFLEFLEAGRLEDVSQLSRQFHKEARVSKVNNFKPFWWLAAIMGQNNLYKGQVYEYQSILGTGATLVSLTPSHEAAKDLEYDEDDPDRYGGDRNVLGSSPEDIEKQSELEVHNPEKMEVDH